MSEEKEKINDGIIMKTLDWAYEKALTGFSGVDSAYEMAESYIKKGNSKWDSANSLIRWQNTKAGTSGFLTGLGGLALLPVSVPANLASVIYIQIRMIAAIAIIGEQNLKDDRIKSLVYACMTGNAIKDILKDTGIVVGGKLTTIAIKKISGQTIKEINKKAGFRLVTKFGEKGAVNLGKLVPIVGGIIGGTADSYSTNIVGNIARNTFIEREKKIESNNSFMLFGMEWHY